MSESENESLANAAFTRADTKLPELCIFVTEGKLAQLFCTFVVFVVSLVSLASINNEKVHNIGERTIPK